MKAEEINEKISELNKSKIRIYPVHNLRASSIGHPCARYLTLELLHWDELPPYDEGLQCIFDLGSHLESLAINKLREAGFDVVSPLEGRQGNWKIDKPYISGREDLRIRDEKGDLIPVEIKWLQPFEWAKLNSVDDFKNSKSLHVRNYPTQLQIYMYQFNKEYGFFFIGNKLTGELKAIYMPFDWELADATLKKATKIYEAYDKITKENGIESECLPDGVEDEDVCSKCKLKHRCGKPFTLPTDCRTDETLENLLDIKEEITKATKEIIAKHPEVTSESNLDDQIKESYGDSTKILAGKWYIERTKTIKPAHTEPEKFIPERVTYRAKIKKLYE